MTPIVNIRIDNPEIKIQIFTIANINTKIKQKCGV